MKFKLTEWILCVGLLIGLSGCATPGSENSEISKETDAIAEVDAGGGDITDDDIQLDEATDNVDAEIAKEESVTLDDPAVDQAAAEVPESPQEVPESSDAGNDSIAESKIEVRDIRYTSENNGGTMEFYFSGPPSYRLREELERNQVVLEVANAELPTKLKRPFNTKDFRQSISSMNAYQDAGSNTARFVFQMRDPGSLRVFQDGNALLVSPSDSTSAPQQAEAESGDDAEKNKDSVTALAPSSLDDSVAFAKFSGKPISLEVRDTPVRDILQLIAEQVGANIIVSDGVAGNLTMKLRQVPWDQALLLVLRTKQLGYVRQGNVLRIAPLTALQAETNEARAVADAQQNAQPLRVKVIPVSYAKPADLRTQIQNFLSPRGKVVDDVRTGAVIVTDTAENIDRVSNLIRALDTPPLQVLIEGKIVEATESFRLDYGLRWNYGGNQVAAGDYLVSQNMNITAPNSSQPNTLNLSIGTFEVFGDIDATLGLAERNSQAKILSSPRIVTLNNENATINQSTAIQIPTTVAVPGGTTTTSFTERRLALQLDVTPQITSESDVIMALTLRREFAGDPGSGGAPPGVNSREAKTRVLVRNGATAVVGGVYQNDNTESEQGIPILKNIPLLGWLFKEKSIIKARNELLLFLTPRILNADKGIVKEENL